MVTRTSSESSESYNLDAERNVLGACLLHVDAASEVCPLLQPQYFYLPRHQIIFRALRATYAAKRITDPIVVGEELARCGRLAEAGGHEQLLDLLESVVTSVGVEYHAEIVLEHARRRRLLELARELQVGAQDGETAASLIERIEGHLRELGNGGVQASQSCMRSWMEVATDPPVAWSIDGIEPAGGNVLLAGEPGSGKTLLAIDKSLRKAHGMSWLGRKCRPGSTLYLAGEGTHGLGARLRAWRAAHPEARPVEGHYVELFDGVPDLTRTSAVEELNRLIESAEKKYGRKPDDVTIDTLAMATPGADENDAGPVGAAQAVLASIRRRHGCSTTTLHHLRKPSNERPNKGQHAVRGSSAIVGAADVVLIAASVGCGWTLTTVKARDGELLSPIPYQIRGQDTGVVLEEGRPEFGPVVLPAADTEKHESPADLDAEADADVGKVVAKLAELGSAPSANTVVRRISGNRQNLLAAWREAVADGLVLNAGTSRDKKWVVAGTAGSAGVCAAPPRTPRGSGTGNQPVAGPNPDPVPGSGGNQSEPPGTGAGKNEAKRQSRRSGRK